MKTNHPSIIYYTVALFRPNSIKHVADDEAMIGHKWHNHLKFPTIPCL